jgi:hypothetical protein
MQFLAIFGIGILIIMYLRWLQVHNPIVFTVCMTILFGVVAMFLHQWANKL